MARANGVRLHTHASENKGECAYVESLVHMRNLRYLHSIGYTGEDVILAHCIWIDDDEIRILADTGTHAVHCPSSNMKLASGIARIDEMLAAGCVWRSGSTGPTTIWTRSWSCGRRASSRSAHQPPHGPVTLQALEMATLGGARALGQEDELGSLEPGKKADLAVINPDRLNMAPRIGRDPVAQVVYQPRTRTWRRPWSTAFSCTGTGSMRPSTSGNACATRKAPAPGYSEARTSRRCSRTSGEARFCRPFGRVPHTPQRLRLCTPQGAPLARP